MTCWKEGKREKTQNFIWVGWEQTFSLIYSNTSKDLKGKLALHQFADTQVGAGNKDQQKTKRYCTDCTIYYRSWTFFHSCIPQKETAAVKRRRRQEFAKISLHDVSLSQIQFSNFNMARTIIMLCGRSDDQSEFIKQKKLATIAKMKECRWGHYWSWRKKMPLKENKDRPSENRTWHVPNQTPNTKKQNRLERRMKLNQARSSDTSHTPVCSFCRELNSYFFKKN